MARPRGRAAQGDPQGRGPAGRRRRAHRPGAPQDVTTPAGVRKPDVFAVARDVARAALERQTRTYYGPDLILVAEVVTPRTVNEQIDRVRKVDEYAATGIPHYWLVDLEPRPTLTLMELRDGRYELTGKARSGETVTLDRPFPIAFDPARLSEME
ncbi:Uma2 family endonuclease [Actinomadura madurae]|nr:Uma2 family endonuclease [Actinomadura madurae]